MTEMVSVLVCEECGQIAVLPEEDRQGDEERPHDEGAWYCPDGHDAGLREIGSVGSPVLPDEIPQEEPKPAKRRRRIRKS